MKLAINFVIWNTTLLTFVMFLVVISMNQGKLVPSAIISVLLVVLPPVLVYFFSKFVYHTKQDKINWDNYFNKRKED